MASVYARRQSPGWWAKFRGARGDLRRCRTPINIEGDGSEALALAWAQRMETLAAAWRAQGDLESLEMLVSEGAESPALLVEAVMGQQREESRQRTITTALEAHPSYQRLQARAAEGDPRARSDIKRHHTSIEMFEAAVGQSGWAALTLRNATTWVEQLRQAGVPWDTRRHHLLAIRRAAAGAALYGRTDQLAGKRLDRREMPTEDDGDIIVYSAEEMRAIYHAAAGDPPFQLAFGLMGFAGLRPSELIRLQARDWHRASSSLRVGARQAKNLSSRRNLPLPADLARLVRRYVRDLEPEAPLLMVPAYAGSGHIVPIGWRGMRPQDLSKWWAGRLAETLKSEELAKFPALPPKSMRKSFASAAMWELEQPERLIDLYMGHRAIELLPVTSGHYLSRVTKRLIEIAEAFQGLIAGD